MLTFELCFEINIGDTGFKYKQDKAIIERPVSAQKRKIRPKLGTNLGANTVEIDLMNKSQKNMIMEKESIIQEMRAKLMEKDDIIKKVTEEPQKTKVYRLD